MSFTPNRWWETSVDGQNGGDGEGGDNNMNMNAQPPAFHAFQFHETPDFMTGYYPQNSVLDHSFTYGQIAQPLTSPSSVPAVQSPFYRRASDWQPAPSPLRDNFNSQPLLGAESNSRGDWLHNSLVPQNHPLACDSSHPSFLDLTESPIQRNFQRHIQTSQDTYDNLQNHSYFLQPQSDPALAMPVTRSSRYGATPTPITTSVAAEPDVQERATKRRRVTKDIGAGSSSAKQSIKNEESHSEPVEEVDLTEVDSAADVAATLAKQRQDAVEAQQKASRHHHSGRTALTSYKCPICMDTPEDVTTTLCGHLFCHKCIIDTLRWSERQRQEEARNNKAKGTCPVCRKPLAIKDGAGTGRTLVPLQIKLLRRRDLGKGKESALL